MILNPLATPEKTVPTPELSIIIISYNTRDLTLECLRSVYAQTSCDFEVLVVDNASSDGSVDAIKVEFPDIRLFAETENHGFGPAHHIAMEHASGAYVLFLNPDTVVLEHALDKLLAFAKATPNAGIWGGRTLFADGRINPTSCWHAMSTWSLICQVTGLNRIFAKIPVLNPEAAGGRLGSKPVAVDIVTGCFLLIKAETWFQLGGFNKLYKMYGEETDFCLRATKTLGAQPMVTPAATIIHHGGASEPSATEKMIRLLRAKTQLIRCHFGFHNRAIALRLLQWWPFSRWLMFAVASRLLRSPSLKARSQHWRQIWMRRDEWSSGFENA